MKQEDLTLPKLPSFKLDGKHAVVTGAGRGIGLAVAAGFAEAGAEVTLLARTAPDVEVAAEAIIKSGGKARAIVLDVTDYNAVNLFFAEQQAFDVLVNNAGTNRPKMVLDVTSDDYDAVLDLNLKSAYFVAQACAQKMVASKLAGSMIHISSQMGHVGGSNRSLYCASKWGVEGMSKAMALDLAPHQIRSNTLAPTFIETPMTKPFFENKTFLSSVLNKIKLGRIGTVQDIMGAALFLASDASSLMTGTSLVVDGGWTAE